MSQTHSVRASGTSTTEVFFPNNMGASILRTKKGKVDEFDVTLIVGTEDDFDWYPKNSVITDEGGCREMLEKIRMLAPD